MPLPERSLTGYCGRCARRRNWLAACLCAALAYWVAAFIVPTAGHAAPAPPSLQAVTDRITYNAGETVRLKIVFPTQQDAHAFGRCLFTLRYAGEERSVAEGTITANAERTEADASGYHPVWEIPLDARTGRYEIDLRVQDPQTHGLIQDLPHVCSFVVHRQVARIVSTETSQAYYTSGDAVGCTVQIENLGARPLAGLRLEFSERYWPWIAQQRERVGTDIQTLKSDFTLEPQRQLTVSSPRCTVAKGGSEPSIRQYAAVIWDHDRKNVYAISFTPIIFVNPPGAVTPRPYPAWFAYPNLDTVNTRSYREFRPAPFSAGAIQFETGHTMYPPGSNAAISFSLANPTDGPWRQVTVRVRLVGPDQKELYRQVAADHADLDPHGTPRKFEVKLPIPEGASGLFRAVAEVTAASGQVVAANSLELGVNPLPQSVLLFCAHEDDDGTQMGFLRALVENHVPLHVVYFTSGDAGSCDRYYGHSCGPAEALSFGALRMDEARAALGHLGVPRHDILFLGLPDGGSGKIWYDHRGSRDPYFAVQLASEHAPYEGLFRPNLPYAREAVVDATAEIIRKFQPDVVFTAHPPAEGHIDHIVCNYFVVKALQQLVQEGTVRPSLEVRVDRVFSPRDRPATPYHYEDHTFYVSGDIMALAQEAGWYYQSQGGNRGEGNLRTWSQLPRSEGYRKMLDWNEHPGWNDTE